MSSEIFRAGMQVPQNFDGISAAPKGYKEYFDLDKEHGTEWMKTIIQANYPAITSLMVFHDAKSDVGGKMIVRFLYNGHPIELPVTYQQKFNTLTPQEFQYLAPHIQRMNPETRGLFNVILRHIGKLEAKEKGVKTHTHAQLEDLAHTTQTA